MIIDYRISIEESKIQEFLQIMTSLKNSGVVKSALPFSNLGLIGKAVSTQTLLTTLQQSEEEIAKGQGISQENIKDLFATWKKDA